jgi:hypothetical protein
MGQMGSMIKNIGNNKVQNKVKVDEEVPTVQDKYEDDA